MSRLGLIVAGQYSVDLPRFCGIAEAKESLFASRDLALQQMLSDSDLPVQLDFSPQSLMALEHWYFSSGQPNALSSGFSVPHLIGFYFGEIFVRCANFNWVVEEFTFSKGHYEIGIQRSLITIMLTKGKLPKSIGNKRMQSLLNEFKRYVPEQK